MVAYVPFMVNSGYVSGTTILIKILWIFYVDWSKLYNFLLRFPYL